MSGQQHAPSPLYPPENTRYPLYRRLSGSQGRSGRAENLVLTGIRSRTVQHVAQSLYRLTYPAHYYVMYPVLFYCLCTILLQIMGGFRDPVLEFHRLTCFKCKIRSERIPVVSRMLIYKLASIVLNVMALSFMYSVMRYHRKPDL